MPQLRVSGPRRGIFDDFQANLNEFPPDAAPSLLNFRVSKGVWETRLGCELQSPVIPGSGRTTLCASIYPNDGSRIRMAARGTAGTVALWDLKAGTDVTYQAVDDSASSPVDDLGGGRLHLQLLLDKVYIANGGGGLRMYDPSTRTCDVIAGLATPSAAPEAKKTWYRYVETWQTLASPPVYQGWDQVGNTVFTNLTGVGANDPGIAMAGGSVNRMRVDNTGGPTGEVLTKVAVPAVPVLTNPLGIALQTYQLGFWINQTSARTLISFQWGQDRANEQSYQIDPQAANVSYPVFLDVGGLKTLNFLRSKNTAEVPTTRNERNLYLSGIVQCGRLSGQYQWRMTYYRPSTDEEGPPSEPGPGTPMEFLEGRSLNQSTATAMRRSAFLAGPTNPSKVAGDKKVFYRTGGVPSLSVDVMGQPVYTYVGECLDFATTLNGATLAGAITFVVTDASGIADGDWLVIDKGTATEEYVQISDITGTTCTPYSPLAYAHSNLDAVEVGLLDNVSNEVLAAEVRRLDVDRDAPPEETVWVVALPNGRLAVAPFEEDGEMQWLKVALSNQPQPINGRRADMRIFPKDVDPYTQRSLTQGFRSLVATDARGDRIMWMGLYRGWLTALTMNACYQTRDWSQAQWSAGSWIKRFDRGTICGDAVQEVNGNLIFPSDGPSIVLWNGVDGGPKDISFLRVSRAVGNAPGGYAESDVFSADELTAYWQYWFAQAHAKGQSIYYRLFMTPDDPLEQEFDDLIVNEVSPEVIVSSATRDFTDADIGMLIYVPDPASTGWTPGWYQIIGIDGTSAILDRAPAAPNGEIEFVDEIGFEGQTSTGGSNSFSIVLTRNVTVGDWVFVFSQISDTGGGTGTFGTPTDDKGNTYTLVKLVNNGILHVGIWASQVTTALEVGDEITQQFNNYRNLIFRASQFRGIVDGAVPSQTIDDDGVDNTSTTEPFAALSEVPQLLLCVLGTHAENSANSQGDNTGVAGSGWTKLTAPTGVSSNQGGDAWNDDLFAEWRVVEALPSTPTGDWTYTPFPTNLVTQRWALLGAAFPATAPGIAALFRPWNPRRLDYDVVNDAWEPQEHRGDYNEDGEGELALGWDCGEVRYGYGDTRGLFMAQMNAEDGNVFQLEVGDDDNGVPIYIYAETPRINTPEGDVRSMQDLFLRLAREATESDRLTVITRMGGSEYPQKDVPYQVLLQGDGDTEIAVYQELEADLARGRWVQFILEENVSQRPAPRELTGTFYDIGDRRINE